ncbi:serpin family protein [Streptomyces sp. NPDC101132]|uniref:serpin family protein n=1 Tax=Streptomyces sp. NPDC101132 TaxID=3366110 RepID=UPI00380674F6
MRDSTIRAVNRLTSRWVETAVDGAGSTVLTAAGVWPLLAQLADGAGGPARGELAGALGIPPERAAAAALELLDALGRVRGLDAATGLWAHQDLPLDPEWSARLPEGTRGTLSGDPEKDRAALDAWAAEHTGGRIDRMPGEVDASTLLVLASAFALRLRWIRPFKAGSGDASQGPWAGREFLCLRRSTSLLDRVRVADTAGGRVTVLEVVGDGGVDVHLVLGEPGAAPGGLLSGGVDVVTRAVASVDGYALPDGAPGPGLAVGARRSYSREPRLDVATAAFEVEGDHDLLERARLFGLEAASDSSSGHFPGISAVPLAVHRGRQSAMARFHAEGFEASAVTAFYAAAGCAATLPPYVIRRIGVTLDRPFGFLAVHRTSRLVLAAGWVAEPLPYVHQEPDEDDDWDEDWDDQHR